ncbi:fumarylacetoacetate hydrolase family protein [Nitratireductor pacificus]|uniref:Fumarylacetoacetate (FAA) hydrolase n=1 Tax=Nitratireductor pacificus pht-3B TaxID=391937 RepID=K2N1W3_9HYPH|nr:fumarylacetoacetate hydrolase family protein [Nitratireductor pacificus]EKF18183.1 fumarylacetoacetate (FAA) hydrolase [Nitratireductor pacificus pht-3B]
MPVIAFGTYASGGREAPAVICDGAVYDAEALRDAGIHVPEGDWSNGEAARFLENLCADRSDWGAVADAVRTAAAAGAVRAVPDTAQLAAPFRPGRIFCAASNFVDHADEMGTVLAAKAESKPYMFLKLEDCVIGPGQPVLMPEATSQLDWEVELAAVIGKRARHVSVADALSHVAAYTVVNDVTARDMNVRSDYPFKFDWFQGKCHDSFAPFGPWLVPASQIPDPQKVGLRLSVNGAVMQQGTAEEMIWKVNEQIAYLSTILTLKPGDVIATGTPTGVGMGRGIFLKRGDVMTAAIVEIGEITNPVQ